MADGSPVNDEAFGIGSRVWPGLSKLIEEAGEVQQVAGKIIGCGGAPTHFDGSEMRARLESELGDLLAAIVFVVNENALSDSAIQGRTEVKLDLFNKWRAEASANG